MYTGATIDQLCHSSASDLPHQRVSAVTGASSVVGAARHRLHARRRPVSAADRDGNHGCDQWDREHRHHGPRRDDRPRGDGAAHDSRPTRHIRRGSHQGFGAR